jgi:hypothetical protein
MITNFLIGAVNVSSTEMNLAMFGLLSWIAAMFAAFMLIAVVVSILVYIYSSLVLFTIGKKLGYKRSWLAWIPVANLAMILQLGNFHWALVFLLLVPILGTIAVAVLLIISLWRIYEKRKYSGWLSLVPLLSVIPVVGFLAGIAHLVIMGVVAWKNK